MSNSRVGNFISWVILLGIVATLVYGVIAHWREVPSDLPNDEPHPTHNDPRF